MNAWRMLFLVVMAIVLSGCPEVAYRMNDMVGLNCRPEAIQKYGSCAAATPAHK